MNLDLFLYFTSQCRLFFSGSNRCKEITFVQSRRNIFSFTKKKIFFKTNISVYLLIVIESAVEGLVLQCIDSTRSYIEEYRGRNKMVYFIQRVFGNWKIKLLKKKNYPTP